MVLNNLCFLLLAISSLASAHLDSLFFKSLSQCLPEAKYYSVNVMLSDSPDDDSHLIQHAELFDTLKGTYVRFVQR